MQFEKINLKRVPRSFQNLSYEKKFSADMGKLYPCYIEECLAGDRMKLSNECVIRFQPLVAPILHNINVHFEYFFVPFRIMFDDWEEFLTGGVDGEASESVELPLWDDYNADSGNGAPPKYSLWDYFGLPLVSPPDDADTPLSFARTAYNMIWNRYYRDETIDSEVSEDNNDVLSRRWQKDYFTSALPFQQRGVAPSFPLTGRAPLIGDPLYSGSLPISPNPYVFADVKYSQSGTSHKGNTMTFYGHNTNGLDSRVTGPAYSVPTEQIPVDGSKYSESYGNFSYTHRIDSTIDMSRSFADASFVSSDLSGVYADMANVSTFDISELRLANQIQLFLELNARSGYRYDEFLLAHFGVAPKSAVIQEPEFLGSSVSPLYVSEVLQTSETTATSPQGNLAGRGLGASKNFIAKFTAPEPGLVIGIMSIVPALNYSSQGIGKMWTRRSRYDFYFPEFAHLSEQPILKKELYLMSDTDKNNLVFGYQGIYDEYRHRRSEVCADMRDTFDYWHLARKFNSEPFLNSSFLSMDPRKDIFAVQDEPGFIVDLMNICKAVRPIPSFAIPGGLRF